MKPNPFTALALALLLSISCGAARASGTPLTLDAAVQAAIETDPWLSGSRETESALRDEAVAAGSLPDPRLNLQALNFPAWSFDINQEPMTQLAVGVSQQFPRGRSLELARTQKEVLAEAEPMRRADRRAMLTASVSRLYLDAYLAQQSRSLIEQDRALFEQLADAAESQYASAVGQARQQDLIRAQLELTRLDDRLTVLKQRQDTAWQRLSEFIGVQQGELATTLPELARPGQPMSTGPTDPQSLFEEMRRHPAVLAGEQRIASVATGVDLARQKYRPGWALNAQYGYRADDTLGNSRDDLVSVGVSVDLPLFHANRQDREVSAAQAREAAARSDLDLLVRQLVAELETGRAELARLNERRALYAERLLPQMSQQSEASLSAYNNADGDFAEAVRARIAELDTKIDALAIDVARQQTLARLNYLLTRMPAEQEPSTADGDPS